MLLDETRAARHALAPSSLHSGGRRSRSKTVQNALPQRGHPSLFSGKKNQEPLKRCGKSSTESTMKWPSLSSRMVDGGHTYRYWIANGLSQSTIRGLLPHEKVRRRAAFGST
jgi:hypothetical protein